MPVTQAYRELEIFTPLGKDALLLRGFSFQEQLGQLFSLEAELLCTEEDINFEDLLGQNATLRMDMPGKTTRFINGYITQLSQTGFNKGFVVYRATLSPWLWFFTRTSDCRIFQDKTVPDIIKDVFKARGFTDFEERLTGSYRAWEYCVQYRETDFNFVSRLMEQEGIYYYFEHENGKHTLMLADAYSAHKPIKGYETIPFYPPDDTVTRTEDFVSDWAINKVIQPGAYALTDYNFKKPNADISGLHQKTPGHEADDLEIFDYPGEYNEASEGNSYSKIRLQELQASYERMQGLSNARGLTAGGLFKLSKFHRNDQNKEYLVVSVNHTAQQDLFSSSGPGGGGGTLYSNSFSVIDSHREYRSPRTTPKPTVQGLQTAVVVGPSGEEIHTDKYGRVKCQFFWDRYSQANEKSSCWIRVAQSMAGNQWGSMFLPRIGHEVIVEFLEGDPDKPLITGQVYNDANKPPYELPAKKNISGLKSRSTKGGGGFNEFTLDDTKGKEQVFIHAERQHDQRTKQDHLTWIGRHQHHIVEGSYFDSIYGDRHETTGGDYNLKIKDTLSVDVEMDIQQKAGMKYAHESGMEIHLKAGMNVVIEAGVNITLKAGSDFITIGPAGIFISGTMVMINSGGSAGSGSGSNPDKAKYPKEADNRQPGQDSKTKGKSKKVKPLQPTPTAMVLSSASKDGKPFCEKCAKAAAALKKSQQDQSIKDDDWLE